MMVENNEKIWKKFLRNHWKVLALIIVIAILAVIGAIYVFLWFVRDVQLTGLVPIYLELWSMGHIITFSLHLIFWEFIYIVIPVIIAFAAVYLLWWKNLPEMERKEYRRAHLFGKRSRRADVGGGFSFLIFIVFCIKVFYDGRWGDAIATWKFDYLVSSWITVLIWIAIIFGIPMIIGGTLWLRYQMKKES